MTSPNNHKSCETSHVTIPVTLVRHKHSKSVHYIEADKEFVASC